MWNVLRDILKFKEEPINMWHSWDPTPWKHPWLTKENLSNMRTYSQEKRLWLREAVVNIDPKDYSFAFCGNMGNLLYSRAVFLRKARLEIQMFLHPSDQYVMSHPVWEELDGVLSDSILEIDKLKDSGVIFPEVAGVQCYSGSWEWQSNKKLNSHDSLKTAIVKRIQGYPSYGYFMDSYVALQKFDALLCTQIPYFGYLSRRPYLVTACGGDLWYEASRADEYGNLQRKSFEMANIFLVSNPWIYSHARRYGFKHLMYLPLTLDQDVYSPGIRRSRQTWEQESGGSFFVLVTARLDKYYKGFTDWIESFAQFVRMVPAARLCLIKWGEDQKLFIEYAEKLDIQDKIIWLPISGKAMVRDYLRSADCLIDQFAVGYYGATCIEAMACGLPVIARFEQEQYASVCEAGPPPILQAESEEDVVSHLLTLVRFPQLRAELSEKSRLWFLENHGSEKWKSDYIAALVATACGQSISFKDSPLCAPLSKAEQEYHAYGLSNAPQFPNYR